MQIPYTRHLRHRHFDRTRHSEQLLAFLDEQAARLSSTPEDVFEMLKTMTAEHIANSAAPVAPSNTAVPTITGTPAVAATLTAAPGTWTGTAPIAYTYQWKKGGAAIAGATATTYVVASGDAGSAITVTVTATNSVGNASATSAAVNIPSAQSA